MNHFTKFLTLSLIICFSLGLTPGYAVETVKDNDTAVATDNSSKMPATPKVQTLPVPNIPKPVVKPFTPPVNTAPVTPSYASPVARTKAMTAAQIAAMEKAESKLAKTTLGNLQEAFNGESNAYNRYTAFAKKADEEGYGKVASLFRTAAAAEKIHLEHHASVIKKLGGNPTARIEPLQVKTTKENLEAAIKGETYETTVMYPGFFALAKKEKNKDAMEAFEDAGAAEAVHAKLYKNALSNLGAWRTGASDFYLCPFCGNIVEKLDFRKCPICKFDKSKFVKIR